MSAAYGPLRAQPYPWPFDGTFTPASTALVCIDWQADFCGEGGYVDLMGYDLALTRAGLEPTARALAAMRERGFTVVHTREGHRPDLADCPPNKLWRSRNIGAGIGDACPYGRILVRGDPGWEIVPEVAPIDRELIIDKPGKGRSMPPTSSFCSVSAGSRTSFSPELPLMYVCTRRCGRPMTVVMNACC